MRVGPRYSEQFQADAVALLHKSGRTIAEVAQDLGISHQSLRNWYNASSMGKRKKRPAKVVLAEKKLEQAAAQTPEERIAWLERQVASLEKENEELREDRAILKNRQRLRRTCFARNSARGLEGAAGCFLAI